MASVDADIQGKIDSVFNPSGGTIRGCNRRADPGKRQGGPWKDEDLVL